MRYLSIVAIVVYASLSSAAFAQSEIIDKSVAPTVSTLGLSSDDYPVAARKKHGGIRLLLAIDALGKVYRCSILVSSGVPQLDAQTCALLIRGRTYIPAKDQMGAAVPSEVSEGVSWGVPSVSPYDATIYANSLPNGKSQVLFAIRQLVSADGKLEFCAIDRSSGVDSIDRQACQLARGVLPSQYLKDIGGKSVRGLRRSLISLVVDNNSKSDK